MSNDDNRYADDGVDQRLSAAYRKLATETTPPDLDAAILAEARRPVRTERTGLARWRRPLAWATMIALSFAIVHEFNQTGTLPDAEYAESTGQDAPAVLLERSPPDTATLPGPDVGSVSGFTAFDRDERLEKLSEEAAQRAKRARDEELSTMSAPQGTVRSEPATGNGQPPEDVKATIHPGRPETAPAGTSRRAPGASSLAADADTAESLAAPSDTDDGACSAEARSDPARWRDCIGGLMARGRSVDARAELDLYRERFPDEPVPDLTQ